MELTPETIMRIEEMGIHIRDRRLQICIPDARRHMWTVMQTILGQRAQWHTEYDQIAQWLTDNKGRGLLLMGTPGLGKSLMCERVLPTVVGLQMGMWFHTYSAVQLNTSYEQISRHRLLSIDDIGTEAAETKDYGTAHSYFNELLDLSEHRDKTLLLSTNLTWQQLLSRYGQRIDRLRALVHPIVLKGESHR